MKIIPIALLLALAAVVALPPQRGAGEAAGDDAVLFIAQRETIAPQSEPPEKDLQQAAVGDEAEICLLDEGEDKNVNVQAYLTAVVLCEMPVSFEMEALKAQAVAARTFLWKQAQGDRHEDADVCADSACCQAWRSMDALREMYGGGFDDAWEKAAQAVRETKDEVLCYDGALIDATYFSCSGGSTEAAVAVWGVDVPYLQAVNSPGEQDAARYESEAVFSAEEFRAIIEAADEKADLSGSPETWITDATRTEGGGVDTLQIGGRPFRGTRLRELFSLRSTRFDVEASDDGVTFHVLGYGHRVGMSQYGAQHLAQQGFSYRVILQYYYQNTRIRLYPELE